MTFEPFNVLSLPIEFDQDKAHYAKIKIIYIYDIDKYKKYELSIKPGQYIITNLLEKIKLKV